MTKQLTELEIEEFLAIRKEVDRKIDSETAEVTWTYADVLDPYGLFPEYETVCVGREYFARSPGR